MGLFSDEVESHSNLSPASGGYQFIASWAEISLRSNGGCRWCQFLLGARVAEEDANSEEALNIIVGIRGYNTFTVVINDRPRFGGFLSTEHDDLAASFIPYRPLLLDVGSPRAFDLTRECLVNCHNMHSNCRQPPSPAPRLPTRCVDCSYPAHPKLVDTYGNCGAYAALSYVWGGPQAQAITKSNIIEYKHSIDLLSLPQTVVDAILVAHQIGLQYLWIDSLCIIQDDDDDKHTELARMRLIYRDAYITLCAASAHGAQEGFLRDRPSHSPSLIPSYEVVIPFICPGEQRTVGQVCVTLLWVDSILEDVKEYDPVMEPVNARAWCFQELVLSPRVLIFATHTLQYWCRYGLVNVGGSFNTSSFVTYLPDVLLQPDMPPELMTGSDIWKKVRTSWREMLRAYSQRAATISGDKLVAVAGVAEEFGRAFRAPYLAGLWQDALLADMLWNKARDCPKLQRPQDYRAPSWSWASVDGGVQSGPVFLDPDNCVAEVIRCEVALKHESLAFGEVTGGELLIRAPLVQCIWRAGNSSDSSQLYWVRPPLDPRALDLATTEELENFQEVERIGVFFHDSIDDEGCKVVYAMPVHLSMGWLTAGVVLRALEESQEPKHYRRLGFFHTSADGARDSVEWVKTVPSLEITVV
ncbi:hypothetical protein HGRIS_007150 [Hohenbuehelia grisea]|uniref:Heterokaryon incompatibility domain-containing protein n=1 Tax=Hohenbuehelia grisea TaxID=104357 RepID=A0ABR3JBS4_9AGAR